MKKDATKKTNREDWHPADIKAALHKRGITMAALAKAHGIKGSTSLSHAFTHSMPLSERRIADALDLHPMEIWPSRYNEDGTPKPRGFRAVQCTPVEINRNGKAVAITGKTQQVG